MAKPRVLIATNAYRIVDRGENWRWRFVVEMEDGRDALQRMRYKRVELSEAMNYIVQELGASLVRREKRRRKAAAKKAAEARAK